MYRHAKPLRSLRENLCALCVKKRGNLFHEKLLLPFLLRHIIHIERRHIGLHLTIVPR